MEIGSIEGPVGGMPDTSIMDPTMDDLFGEATGDLVTAMPTPPVPAALLVRLADMQSRGCCRKLAWSNTGSIAYIARDGSQVTFRAMVRHPKTGAWTASEPSKHAIQAPEGRVFVHLQFNGIGIELAVVDDAGVVHMYTLTGALSRMVPAAGGDLSRKTDEHSMNAIVGMHWYVGPEHEMYARHLLIVPGAT